MMQTSQAIDAAHHAGSNVVLLTTRPPAPAAGLSAAAMARYLRETSAASARCFALEMQERAAWANESWGDYWADVARLV
jgi:hypothetical protein